VIALLPFPSILRMMAQDMNWTQQLGTAVLNQRAAMMDAVQRMRRQAYDYGYLRRTNTSAYATMQATLQSIRSILNTFTC
jgi:hypothetical protein